MDWEFFANLLKIVIIDLTLAGDNALVIALAVRRLPPRQKQIGIIAGAGGAVFIRVILTFVAAQLLTLPLLQLIGGLLLLWIAVRLLRHGGEGEAHVQESGSLIEAIRIIIIADVVMSTDNVLAVAGASHGSFFLLMFGLGLSIPIVVIGASLIATMMNKWPWLIYVGAGILGEVAGKMICEDHFVTSRLGEPSTAVELAVRAGLAIGVVVIGMMLARKQPAAKPSEAT